MKKYLAIEKEIDAAFLYAKTMADNMCNAELSPRDRVLSAEEAKRAILRTKQQLDMLLTCVLRGPAGMMQEEIQ